MRAKSPRTSSSPRSWCGQFNSSLISEKIASVCRKMTIGFIFKNIPIENLYELFIKNAKSGDIIFYCEIVQTLQK